MKAVILGKGQSNSTYNHEEHADSFVVGVNDGYWLNKGVKAVVCMDKYSDIANKRWKALSTPIKIPMYVREGVGWDRFACTRPNVHTVSTRIASIGSPNPRVLWYHGYTSAFFGAILALHEGADSIDFHGLDGDCFTASQQGIMIRELNYLAKHCKVGLSHKSYLWAMNDSGLIPMVTLDENIERI